MTDGETSIPIKSPSGEGHYTKTDQGFEIRFSGFGLSCIGSLGLAAFWAAMLIAGMFGVERFGDLLPWSPTLLDSLSVASSVFVGFMGLVGMLSLIVDSAAKHRIVYQGRFLVFNFGMEPGFYGLCIPVEDILAIQVRLYNQFRSNVHADHDASNLDRKKRWYEYTHLSFHTESGKLASFESLSFEDQRWCMEILRKHLPVRSSAIEQEQPDSPDHDRSSPSMSDAMKSSTSRFESWFVACSILGVLGGCIGFVFWWHPFLENSTAETLKQTIWWLHICLVSILLIAPVLCGLMMWRVVQNIKKQQPKPRGTGRYRRKIDAKLLSGETQTLDVA